MAIEDRFVDVRDANIHYLEAGEGDPILLLHGIPTASFIWRKVIPHLSPLGRCIAPDLVGFGQSSKPNIDYSILDHINYIEAFIETLGLNNIILVMHGWGSVIGLDYAMKHQSNCVGLVLYEAFLRSQDKTDISLAYQEQILELDEENLTHDETVPGSVYIEKMIPQIIMKNLTNEEMEHYRKPFLQKGSGKPIQQYLNELPRIDQDGKVVQIIDQYSKKLTESKLPKLMLYSIPGFITTIATAMWAKDNVPNLEIVDVGEELHLAQESYPDLMGEAISIWLQGVEQAHD